MALTAIPMALMTRAALWRSTVGPASAADGVRRAPSPARTVRALPSLPRAECCDANRNCADHGKDDLPRVGRHRVLHDPMGGVIAGERGGCDEDYRDREAQPERSHEGEHELADAERQRGGDKADDDPAGPACAGLISPSASGRAGEDWQRKYGECEQKPAKRADCCDASPYISHHLCMIGQICEEACWFFCRRGAPWRRQTREVLERYLAAKAAKGVSVGLGVMPRGLRVAAARVRRARRERWRRRRDGWQRIPRHGPPDTLTPSRP